MHNAVEAIAHGTFLGLISACSLGPIFFTILETSISRGFRKAIGIAFGAFISDSIYITISFLSLGAMMEADFIKKIMGLCGGVLLICFGIYHLFKQPPEPHTHLPQQSFSILFFFKGFTINSINPFVIVYWFSAVSIVEVDQSYTMEDKIAFFIAAVGCNFSFDVLKSFLARRVKRLLSHGRILVLYKIAGIALIAFGIRLLWKVFLV